MLLPEGNLGKFRRMRIEFRSAAPAYGLPRAKVRTLAVKGSHGPKALAAELETTEGLEPSTFGFGARHSIH